MSKYHGNTKHGYRTQKNKVPEYDIWNMMKQRCHNPNNHAYSYYGARGIKVCKRWRDSFVNFLQDMGKKPGKGYHLDRLDNNKGYSPTNCKWVKAKTNFNNRRSCKFITYKGETLTMGQWEEKLGYSKGLIHSRIKAGWSEKRAIETCPSAYRGRANEE